MHKRDAAIQQAKRAGHTMLVLNLNRYSPLYVVRDYSDTLAFSDSVVAVVEPTGTAKCTTPAWCSTSI
jgi:hypothetical protein